MEDPMALHKKLIDQLLPDYKKPEDIVGENGLLKQLTKAILERALQAEMTDHLGLRKARPGGPVGETLARKHLDRAHGVGGGAGTYFL